MKLVKNFQFKHSIQLSRTALYLSLSAGLALSGMVSTVNAQSNPPLSDWPHVNSVIKTDLAIEKRVQDIVSNMTLAQKVGQITQAEIKSITPEEVRKYYIGSVLNGGGSWPSQNKLSTALDWLNLADKYYDASMSTDMKTPVPVIWGTDAVHGHSNLYGATIFPHNIGLGAARNPQLIEDIAISTGRAVRATGISWVFAPAVPVVQNARWGRTYESYSQDPELVREYSTYYVRGLQGDFSKSTNAVASVKHYLGDGGTENGKDQGITKTTLKDLINIHGLGYLGALEAGSQTVMASFNSWHDLDTGIDHGKMHGNKELLTNALKNKMGFDGFVISDWNATGQLPGCTNGSCAAAINAGIDMVMVPDDWKEFITNTIKQVESGEIPMSRLDDAVSRILRVKLRSGLFDQGKPSSNANAGKMEAVKDRQLARQAVRESLVLLKNQNALLPLQPNKKVLVVGKTADHIGNQSGGWSLTWQGTDNQNSDFPTADSILSGIKEIAGTNNVVFSEKAEGINVADYDVVIAVIGETPYAETSGDISPSDTMTHSRRYPEDLSVLQAVSGKGKPVVTVFVSGRPLYTNDLLNMSDAFVAAWLPGTEGKGVADVLFTDSKGKTVYDIKGKLSFPWPNVACPAPRAVGLKGEAPLFDMGYGLSYKQAGNLGQLTMDKAHYCGETTTLPIFNLSDAPPFALYIGSGQDARPLGADVNSVIEWPKDKPVIRVKTVQINTQQDAKEVTWLAPAGFFAMSPSNNNLTGFSEKEGVLQFDMALVNKPNSAVTINMLCGNNNVCESAIDLSNTLNVWKIGEKRTINIPLSCFTKKGANLSNISIPFMVKADAPFAASFTNIKITSEVKKDQLFDCAK